MVKMYLNEFNCSLIKCRPYPLTINYYHLDRGWVESVQSYLDEEHLIIRQAEETKYVLKIWYILAYLAPDVYAPGNQFCSVFGSFGVSENEPV